MNNYGNVSKIIAKSDVVISSNSPNRLFINNSIFYNNTIYTINSPYKAGRATT